MKDQRVTCASCGFDHPVGMKFCGQCGKPLTTAAPASDPVETGRVTRRQMTVLFCDLVGSTPLAERLDAEDLLDVIVAYREACSRAIDRFGGHLARHVGDGLIVFFGYPTALEDDAERAAHAGLAMLDEVAKLNEDLQRRFDVTLEVRIGAHTGEVVAGSIGGVGGADIVGETPNIAARIESLADSNTVLVSDTTAHYLNRYFELEPRGPANLAGVSREVSTFRVVRPTGVVGRIDLTGPLDMTPMQGRDRELQQLTALWDQAKNGDGQVALISAQPGMGKSRMVRALIETVGAEASAVQIWQCSPHQQTRAFHPVVNYLETALDLDRGDRAQAIASIEKALTAADLLSDDACSALAALFSLSADEPGGAAGREARATTLRVLEELLVANRHNLPLLLVVDDAQWADPSTLELLGRITASIHTAPVFILFAARREFELPWELEAPLTRLPLKPLTSDSVGAMLLASTGATSMSSDVRERVVRAADGVPLFVEEMAKMLAAENGFTGTDVMVPASLRGLLMARLDRHTEARDLVSLAAVLGRGFSAELLAAIAPNMPIESWLSALVADGLFVEVTESDNPHYTFSHALLRDIAYGTLLRRQRREFHRTVAQGVADRLPDLGESEPEMLAFHWSRGAAPGRAAPLWHAAGERALKSASFREAADHYRRGLDDVRKAQAGDTGDTDDVLLDDAVHFEAELLTSLGASLQAGFGYATGEVDEIYVEARSTALHSGSYPIDSIDRGEFMMELLRARYSNALEIAAAVQSRGEQTGDPTVLVDGHLYSGLAHMYLANLTEARSHFETAIDHYAPRSGPNEAHDALGDSGAMAMSYLAPVLWVLGHPPDSVRMREMSLMVAEAIARPMTSAQTWGMHALGQIDRGEQQQVALWAERAYQFAHERDITYWRHLSGLVWGWVQGRSGRLSTGLDEVLAHRQAYIESGSLLGLPMFYIFGADLRALEEDHAGGLSDVAHALEHIETTGERYFYSGALRTQARLLLDGPSPDPDAARSALLSAIDFDNKTSARTREFGSVMQCIPICEGEQRTALVARLQELCDWFAANGDVPGMRQAQAILAR